MKYDNTANPIEKYIDWMDRSSHFIFNISGVIPLFENHFLYLKIFAKKCMYWFLYSYIAINFKHQTQDYNNIIIRRS